MDKAIAGLYKEAAKFVAVRRHKHSERNKHKRMDSYLDTYGKWTRIGSGHYGEAWVHEFWPTFALKISGRSNWGSNWYRHRAGDSAPRLDAWPVFAKHCMDNPSVHLPKVLHYEEVSEGIVWAITPKYTKGTQPRWERPATVLRVMEAVERAGDLERLEPWVAGLVELQYNHGLTLDIHSENYMYDTEGNVVIIDPFSTL